MDERWYTSEQIAEQLQVTDQTVRRWLRTGQLRGTRFGGRTGYRVKESDLREFLDRRTSGEAAA